MKSNQTNSLPEYTPRWLYLFFAFLESLPIRPWALAAILSVGVAAAAHGLAWTQGVLPFGKVSPYLLIAGFYFVIGPAQWHYLTLRARPAIAEFFLGRGKTPRQVKTILADFVSLHPFWGAFLFVWGGLEGVYLVAPVFPSVEPIASGGWQAIGAIDSVLGTAFGLILVARILRQSLLTRRFYQEMNVDLFNPTPVYALSRYAVTSIVTLLLVNSALLYILFPAVVFTPFGIFVQIVLNFSFLVFFFSQLLGLNQRMRQAKQNLLAQLGKDMEKVIGLVHKAVDKNAFGTVARMQATVVTLRNQQEIIQKIPTWPWQPETLRNLLLPMLLPVIIYLVQRFLGAQLGF